MKKILSLLASLLLIMVLFACDGGSTSHELGLKSHIDGHTSTIQLTSKVSKFYYGDILNPYSGKSNFTTKTKVSLEVIFNEIKVNSPHFTMKVIDDQYIVLSESTENNKKYNYFIKYVESSDKTNKYMVGETKIPIKDKNASEWELLLFPLYYMKDKQFSSAIDNMEAIYYDHAYAISGDYNINDFLLYYQDMGWVNIEKDNDMLIISSINFSQADFKTYSFIDTFSIDFSQTDYLTISK